MPSEGPLSAKVRVNIQGQSADKLIDAIIDTLSPATETLGAFGDAIRLGRLEIAARATRRANEIAVAHGLALKSPPLKFLVPFYEKASLEEPENVVETDQMVELWATLLVSASSESSSPVFINVLSQINAEDAVLLREIYFGFNFDLSEYQKEYKNNKSLIGPKFSGLLDIGLGFWGLLRDECLKQEDTLGSFLESISDALKRRGFLFDSLGTSSSPLEVRRYFDDEINSQKGRSAQILKSLGLLDFYAEVIEFKGWPVSFSYFKISKLGIQFLQACDMDIKADLKIHFRADEFNYERVILEAPVGHSE